MCACHEAAGRGGCVLTVVQLKEEVGPDCFYWEGGVKWTGRRRARARYRRRLLRCGHCTCRHGLEQVHAQPEERLGTVRTLGRGGGGARCRRASGKKVRHSNTRERHGQERAGKRGLSEGKQADGGWEKDAGLPLQLHLSVRGGRCSERFGAL